MLCLGTYTLEWQKKKNHRTWHFEFRFLGPWIPSRRLERIDVDRFRCESRSLDCDGSSTTRVERKSGCLERLGSFCSPEFKLCSIRGFNQTRRLTRDTNINDAWPSTGRNGEFLPIFLIYCTFVLLFLFCARFLRRTERDSTPRIKSASNRETKRKRKGERIGETGNFHSPRATLARGEHLPNASRTRSSIPRLTFD